jgi:hypothetical protein
MSIEAKYQQFLILVHSGATGVIVGASVAQAVSRRLPIMAVRVRAQV